MARHHSGRLPHYRSRGAARYTKELDGQEDRLAALRKETADRKAKRNQLQSELDAMVMKLTIDETL